MQQTTTIVVVHGQSDNKKNMNTIKINAHTPITIGKEITHEGKQYIVVDNTQTITVTLREAVTNYDNPTCSECEKETDSFTHEKCWTCR